MRRQIETGVVSLLLVSLSATSAWAQQPSEEDLAAAEVHYEKAGRLYYEKDYSGALLELRQAYSLVPEASFLYNISLAHLKLEQYDEALSVALQAAAGGLEPNDHVLNESRIAALRVRRAAVRFEPPVVEVVEVAPTPAAPRPTIIDRLGPTGLAGAGAAGAGLVLLATAGTLGITMQGDIDAYEQAGQRGDLTEYNRLRGELDDTQGLAQVLFYIGLPLTVVGAGLVVWTLSEEEPGEQAIRIAPTPVGFGVSW